MVQSAWMTSISSQRDSNLALMICEPALLVSPFAFYLDVIESSGLLFVDLDN